MNLQNLASLIRHDLSVSFLVATNVFVILLAVFQHWNVLSILWVYWFQSVIIGIFSVFKILLAGQQVDSKNWFLKLMSGFNKLFLAFFFIVHYGIFHFVYVFFLLFFSISGFGTYPSVDWFPIWIGAGCFLVAHFFSFLTNLNEMSKKSSDDYFWQPYARILPMHLTIIFAGWITVLGLANEFVLVFFMLLKTVLDVQTHLIEHQPKTSVPAP